MTRKRSLLMRSLYVFIMLCFVAVLVSGEAKAATTIQKYNDVPAYQYKDVYATDTVTIKGITVNVDRPVKFMLYNTTKQEEYMTVTSSNGVLPDLELEQDHNYIIYPIDSEYQMTRTYVWVKDGKLMDIKDIDLSKDESDPERYNYPEVTSLTLTKRTSTTTDPEEDRRVLLNLPVYYKDGVVAGVTVKLVSDVETITTKTDSNGKLKLLSGGYPSILEEVTYMVTVESDKYDIESFPLAAKDKSEYYSDTGRRGARYFYNHSSCAKVEKLTLVAKGSAHKNDTTVTSISGKTTITGLNFKDILIFEKELDKSLVNGLSGKDYDVLAITSVNPHRWEISKLAAGNFAVTETLSSGKTVANVYYLNSSGKLTKIAFKQTNRKLQFTMNSLSVYPVVIEYKSGSSSSDDNQNETKVTKVKISGLSKNVAAGKSIKLTANVTPAKATNKKVTWKSSNKAVATVDSKGVVTLKKGTGGKKVTITATAKDGSGKKATYQITSMKGIVKKVAISGAKSVKSGKTLKLKAKVTASKNANTKLKWSSSNTKYATVNSSGKVTAKKGGKGKTVTITAQATDGSGKKKAVKINIK
jgi:uncharacterized protein YjdB